jgi:hypothetical protein
MIEAYRSQKQNYGVVLKPMSIWNHLGPMQSHAFNNFNTQKNTEKSYFVLFCCKIPPGLMLSHSALWLLNSCHSPAGRNRMEAFLSSRQITWHLAWAWKGKVAEGLVGHKMPQKCWTRCTNWVTDSATLVSESKSGSWTSPWCSTYVPTKPMGLPSFAERSQETLQEKQFGRSTAW